MQLMIIRKMTMMSDADCAGVNLTAIYQDDELTDKETFQVEFEKRTDQWRLRTADDTYWILVESGNGIQTNGNARYLT